MKTWFLKNKYKKSCSRCGHQSVDVNDVENCDFCLKELTKCDLVDYACCGHGRREFAYIHFKDGRRWIIENDFDDE